MKKLAAFIAMAAIATLLCAATAFAAPPCPGERTLTQPDGQEITATQKGDEWFHWYETAGGDVVVKGGDGWWHFARYENGRLAALDAKAGVDARPAGAIGGQALEKAVRKAAPAASKAARSAAAARRAGGVTGPAGPEKMLVILINFSDFSITQEPGYWSGKMFSDHSAYTTKTDDHSSVNDYYKEVSGGAFYFEPAAESGGTANDGVIEITLGMNHPVFDANDDAAFNADSWTVATEALKAANASIDFSAFDTNGNGAISPNELHIVMMLAGYEQSYAEISPAVWAHSFGLGNDTDGHYPVLTLDGVTVGSDYTEQGELHYYPNPQYETEAHPATIGVLAHELGHSLGLPDLYDYGYDSLGAGVYSLMAGGSWEYNTDSHAGSSPTHLDAWSKYLLGFVTPEAYYTGTHALKSVATGSYNVIKLPTADPKQYFLLENRQRAWGYDRPLAYSCASGGVAVWHVDYNVLDACAAENGGWYYINDDETHKAVDLEEANEGILGYSQLDANIQGWDAPDGYNHLYRTGSQGCNSSFTDATAPSSKLYNGQASGAGFSVGTAFADTMNVTVVPPAITGLTPNKASPQKQHRTVRWTCAATGGVNRTYKFDVVKNSTRTGGTDAYSATATFDWTPAEPGSYTVTVSMLADGISTPITRSAAFTVEADTAKPTVTVTAGGQALANGSVTRSAVAATAADPDGGTVASKTYTLNGGAPVASWPAQFSAEGAYVLTATDATGNAATFTFAIDKTAPAIQAVCGSPLADGMTAGGDVTVTVTEAHPGSKAATKDGAAISWPAGGIFTAAGVYEINAADLAGNAASFRFGILPNGNKLEIKAGSTGLLDGDATESNVSVKLLDTAWTVTVRNGSGAPSTWQTGDAHVFTAEGAYTATVSDTSGHSAVIHFTIDRTAPAISAKNASGAAVTPGSIQKSAVTVTASDITAVTKGAKRNGAAYAWPAGDRFTAEGSYALTVTDKLGHAATFSFSVDLYAPLITLTSGGARVWNNGFARANVTAAVTDVSTVKKSVKRNGAAISWPSGGVFSAEGVYVVTAYDKFARKSSITFTVDKTLPAVTGRQSNGAGAYNSGYYRRSVTVTVSDKYLAGRSVTKNGRAVAWPSRGLFTATGAYKVSARDKAGNTRTFSFVVDKAAPVITVRTLAGVRVGSYGTARGGAVVTVSDGWLASKAVKLGTKYIKWPSTNKFTARGTYTITAKDKAGNVKTFKFYVR